MSNEKTISLYNCKFKKWQCDTFLYVFIDILIVAQGLYLIMVSFLPPVHKTVVGLESGFVQMSTCVCCPASPGVEGHYSQNEIPADESGPRHPAGLPTLQGQVLHPRGQPALQKCPIHEGLRQAFEVAHAPQSPAQV